MKNTTHTDSFLATITYQWGHWLGQMPRGQRPCQTQQFHRPRQLPASAPVIDVDGDTEHQRMQKQLILNLRTILNLVVAAPPPNGHRSIFGDNLPQWRTLANYGRALQAILGSKSRVYRCGIIPWGGWFGRRRRSLTEMSSESPFPTMTGAEKRSIGPIEAFFDQTVVGEAPTVILY
jgi:hypothetical protein